MDDNLRNKILREVNKVKTYYWTQVQTNIAYNNAGSFLFRIFDFEKLIKKIRETIREKRFSEEFEQYTINRWYNYLTQLIVQDFFARHPRVRIEENRRSLYVDIYIDGNPFDIKMTPLPKAFAKKFEEVFKNPTDLIKWLYESEGAHRFHTSPKIFIVVVDLDDFQASWKLKRQFDVIEKVVNKYLEKTRGSEYFRNFTFKIRKTVFKVKMADLFFIVKQKGRYFGRFFLWKRNKPTFVDVV
ncbi:MAG: hypothetical protein QXI58_03970 [Candidatus Micrarchaeia archaeon]